MKKLIGLIVVALLLAACSEGPVQGFFIDLQNHRSYSKAEVTFTCTNDPADNIVKTYELANAAWVIHLDDMRSQLRRDCAVDILPTKVTDLDGMEFDDVIGAYISSVELLGDGGASLFVEPSVPSAPGAKDVTFFYSRGNGRGHFETEDPNDVQVNRIMIGSGWGIYTFIPYQGTGEELKLVNINGVEWVASLPN